MKKGKRMKIATYLVKEGYLSVEQANTVMKIQNSMPMLKRQRFGRIAVNQSFIKEDVLNRAVLYKEKKEFGVK